MSYVDYDVCCQFCQRKSVLSTLSNRGPILPESKVASNPFVEGRRSSHLLYHKLIKIQIVHICDKSILSMPQIQEYTRTVTTSRFIHKDTFSRAVYSSADLGILPEMMEEAA
jgi:hypothetical protein